QTPFASPGTGCRGGYRHTLSIEFAGADHPIDGVLERAGQAVTVFWRRDHNRMALLQRIAPRAHRGRRALLLQVGIEERQVADAVKQHDLHAARRDLCGATQEREVSRLPLQAAAYAQHLHAHLPSRLRAVVTSPAVRSIWWSPQVGTS